MHDVRSVSPTDRGSLTRKCVTVFVRVCVCVCVCARARACVCKCVCGYVRPRVVVVDAVVVERNVVLFEEEALERTHEAVRRRVRLLPSIGAAARRVQQFVRARVCVRACLHVCV